MHDNPAATPGRTARRTLAFLRELVWDYRPRDFAIRLWDGTFWDAEPGTTRRFTLVINHPAAVRAMVREPREASLAEAFLNRDIDVEGDLNAVFPLADHLIDRTWSRRQRWKFGLQLLRLPYESIGERAGRAACLAGACHSRERDRQAISYHYDLSNEFYSLWLDGDLIYSCAYFASEQDDLDAAQQRKLDYLCRKLRLKPGERLLDIGCGWGGLVRYAAREYGAEVTGITVSIEQARLCVERIRKDGLEQRCKVELCDYRELQDRQGFDKIVSVGMFEHVGQRLLPVYFRKAASLLRPGGVFLNHGIAVNALVPVRQGPTFSDRYVFPDGDLLPLSATLSAAEFAGFEVRDVESLREHYALTLAHWYRRFEQKADEARRLTDAATCRIWRLYLAGSAHSFRSGRLNVYQTLLSRTDRGSSNLPLTREDWYPNYVRRNAA